MWRIICREQKYTFTETFPITYQHYLWSTCISSKYAHIFSIFQCLSRDSSVVVMNLKSSSYLMVTGCVTNDITLNGFTNQNHSPNLFRLLAILQSKFWLNNCITDSFKFDIFLKKLIHLCHNLGTNLHGKQSQHIEYQLIPCINNG